MRMSKSENLMVETVAPGVRVIRFERPDVRDCLYEEVNSSESPLFREIKELVLTDLPRGWTLILNLNLVQLIGAAFYRCLLLTRQVVRARQARLVLCGLSREHREVFELFQGFQLFRIMRTEIDAIRAAEAGEE